jgi:integrase
MTITEAIATTKMPGNQADAIVWDAQLPGLGIRFRNGGGQISKRWIVQYRVGHQQRRESLGDVRKLTLTDARKIAKQRFARVQLGFDPAAEKAAKVRSQYTLRSAVDAYLDARRDVIRPSTYNHVERYLRNHWAPLLDRALTEITRADIAGRLTEITRENGRGASGQARKTLAAMFTWAAKEGRCDANPVAFTNDPAEGAKARERVLTDKELAAIWHACGDDDFGRIIRLLILTGARREEIGQLRWSEIDLDAGRLCIPGDRTKSHRMLELTLPPAARDILRTTPRSKGEYFFGRSSNHGFWNWSYGKLAIDGRITATGTPMAKWIIHDIRRTVRTGLSRIGIAPHVAERVIGHAKGGIEAVYDRHKFDVEIAAALERWADHVLAVITP